MGLRGRPSCFELRTSSLETNQEYQYLRWIRDKIQQYLRWVTDKFKPGCYTIACNLLQVIPAKLTSNKTGTHVFPTLEPTKPPIPSHSLMKSCISLFNTHLKKTQPGKIALGLTEMEPFFSFLFSWTAGAYIWQQTISNLENLWILLDITSSLILHLCFQLSNRNIHVYENRQRYPTWILNKFSISLNTTAWI